jgi:hypothetical protein
MHRFPINIGILMLFTTVSTLSCTQSQDEARSEAEQEPGFETLIIPDGTEVVVALTTPLSTGTNNSGDSFAATTVAPINIDGKTVVPAGVPVHGVLQNVQASGRVKGRAQMTLAYQSIGDAEGMTHPISALPLTLQAASATRGDVEKIAAGGVLGAIIGGVAGGGKGAAIGAGAGAGAGTILMLATEGDEVVLPAGQQLSVQMTAPTEIKVMVER